MRRMRRMGEEIDKDELEQFDELGRGWILRLRLTRGAEHAG